MRLLIYPYERESTPFLRYSDMLPEIDSIYPISPDSFGLYGKNAAKCDGGPPLQTIISSNYDMALEETDAVLLLNGINTVEIMDYEDKIYTALDKGKTVFLTKNIYQKLKDPLTLLKNENFVLLDYEETGPIDVSNHRLYQIPIPIIAVAGAGPFCDKFNIQLELRKLFLKDNFHISQIGTKIYSKLFGFHSLPKFLFDSISIEDKILRFNHYIYDIVLKEQTEMLLIGIPGGIMQLNPLYFEEFGEFAFIICNALQIDLGILSLYVDDYTREFLEDLNNICKYKLNIKIHGFHVSTTNMSISQEHKKAEFTICDSKYVFQVMNSIGNSEYNLFSIFEDWSTENLYRSMVEYLSDG